MYADNVNVEKFKVLVPRISNIPHINPINGRRWRKRTMSSLPIDLPVHACMCALVWVCVSKRERERREKRERKRGRVSNGSKHKNTHTHVHTHTHTHTHTHKHKHTHTHTHGHTHITTIYMEANSQDMLQCSVLQLHKIGRASCRERV